jgi:protein-S-isoprenylcysteine O-methyltransferase Ste14
MARPAFKAVWTRVVPEPAERSTFVLAASLLLALLFWQWHPIAGVIWKVDSAVGGVLLQALFWTGWMLVLASTFMINHFDLFGLSQVFLHLRNQPYQPLPFVKVALYRFIRHPIMLGFLIAFWATPFMSLGHLVFTVATTGYIFVGIFLEERDMRRIHGEAYEQYRREAAMLLPLPNPDKPSKSRRPTIYM